MMALFCSFAMQSCEEGAEESDTTPGVGDVTTPGAGSSEAKAPNLISVASGYAKIEVSWLINGAESDVKYCYVYYTNEAGKTSERLVSALKSTDTISTTIAGLADGKYSIYVKNYYESSKSYSEASETKEVVVYGDGYLAGLETREAELSYSVETGGVITWGEKQDGYVGTNISYLDRAGDAVERFCGAEEDETILTDIYGGTDISCQSLFKYTPEAVDTLSAPAVKYRFPLDENETIVVHSLEALMPYMKMDNVNVKLAPGTYEVNASGFSTGKYGASSEVVEGDYKLVLLLVEGDGSTYDFTDVEVQSDVNIFKNLSGYGEYCILQSTGSRNHVIGLTMRDIVPDGEIEFHNAGCTNIIMDGYKNKFESVTVYSTGSYPYGYGEVFGKGGGVTISHQKHCAFLIRGLENHAYRCNVTHYSYGHCMFMQAADKALIEECIIQSEMTTTDEILSEEGTGSAADKIDFKTTWGHRLQPGYTLACSEEGIRAYNAGETIVNGVRYDRGTSNPTIKNCYVKTARAGVTLTHASGTKYVEGTTVIGCDRGFCIGSGDIVNCFADCSYGPAYGVDYEYNSGVNADITILPNELPLMSGNGSKHVAIIIGGKQNLHFKNYSGGTIVPTYGTDPKNEGVTGSYEYVAEPYTDPRQPELAIQIGGDNRTIGMWETDNNYKAENINLINDTGYRIIFDDNSKNCTVTTKGPYEDYGTGNSITGGTDEKGTTPQPANGNVIYGGNSF